MGSPFFAVIATFGVLAERLAEKAKAGCGELFFLSAFICLRQSLEFFIAKFTGTVPKETVSLSGFLLK